MIWWAIVPALVALPVIALWVGAIDRDRDARIHAAGSGSRPPASSGQFVFTRHFFIAGLIEGPYTFELPRGDDPSSSDT
jgi:hypothetical protein